MKLNIFSFFKRKKLPKSKTAVNAVFDAVGVKSSEEWRAIESHFNDCEMPPPEIIYAAYRKFISSKNTYVNGLTHDAYALREDIVTTIISMTPEGDA